MKIIDLLEDLLNHHSATASSRSSALTALAKASYRLGEGLGEDGKARVEEMLEGYRSSITLELQQRSCEYLNLLSPQWDVVKKEALDRMPVMDEEAFRERRARYTMGAGMGAFDDALGAGDRSPKPQGSPSSSAPAAGPPPSKNGLPIPSSSSNGGGDLLDLEDIFGGGGASAPAAAAAAVPPAVAVAAPGAGNGAVAAGGVDLLADVFGGGGGLVPSKAAPANATAAQVPVAAPAAPAAATVGGDSDDFGGFEVAPPREEKMVAFDKSGLRVVFSPSKPDASDPSKSKISIAFTNTSDEEISGLVFQAAVPKSFTMKMGALSGHNLPPHSDGVVSQEINVTNAMQGTKSLMMKLKIQFRRGTVNVAEVAQVAQFPAGF
ncbi:unnamed protein product [Ectocarpus sp. 4 AP-2014]